MSPVINHISQGTCVIYHISYFDETYNRTLYLNYSIQIYLTFVAKKVACRTQCCTCSGEEELGRCTKSLPCAG